MRISITVDGGKHHQHGNSWVGAVVRDIDTGQILRTLSAPCGVATSNSNMREYAAINAGCQRLREFLLRSSSVVASTRDEIVVYSDSQLCVRQLMGIYKIREERLRPLHAEAQRLLTALRAKICWHSREDGDGPLADKLSKGIEVDLGKDNSVPVLAR